MHTHIQDGSIAVTAAWTEEVVIISLTIWISIALKEIPRAELLVAVIACKMLRMELLAERCDDLTYDRLLAARATSFLLCVDSLT